MSYHGLGTSAGFSSGGINVGVNVDVGGGGSGTSPSGCKTTQWDLGTGCDDCANNAVAYCCGKFGGATNKSASNPTTGAFWVDCQNGMRAARQSYGQPVTFFVPGTGYPPPPPPPPAPSKGYPTLKTYFANLAWWKQVSAGSQKLAPGQIKAGGKGKRPPPGGAKKTGGGPVWGKGPTGTPGKVSTGSGSGGSKSSAPSADLLADINRAVGAAKGALPGTSAAKAVSTPGAASTPIVGQGALVSSYETAPPPQVQPTYVPPPAEDNTKYLIAAGVVAVLGIGAYLAMRQP